MAQTVDADTCKKRSVIDDDDCVRTRNQHFQSEVINYQTIFILQPKLVVLEFVLKIVERRQLVHRSALTSTGGDGIRTSERL